MSAWKKLLAAPAGDVGLDVDEVFSTDLYDGTGADLTLTNGIDLSGEGGLVWLKGRIQYSDHYFYDTERGVTKSVSANRSNTESTRSEGLKAFNSNGFKIGSDAEINTIYSSGNVGYKYASYTFRKAPKFFDVVTWTGGGETSLTLDHDLGCAVGWLVVKRLDASDWWYTWFRAGGLGNGYIRLNSTAVKSTYTGLWANTAPTSTQFTVADDFTRSGGQYVAYLFAHNDGDGEFGPDSDQDIIKCGGGTVGTAVDLGFEPQWVLVKSTTAVRDWELFDSMRGIGPTGISDRYFVPNNQNPDDSQDHMDISSTGFTFTYQSGDFIYIAIRRGSLFSPGAGTEVFDVKTRTANEPHFKSDFDRVDFALYKSNISGTGDFYAAPRLISNKVLITNSTSAEINGGTGFVMDFSGGWYGNSSASSTSYSWMWKRAPGYFDVVAYSGNSTAGHTVSHNLGVAPEMMWVKARSGTNAASGSFMVYHSAVGAGKAMYLNADNTPSTSAVWWNNTAPTSTVFTLGTSYHVNKTGAEDIAFLFATLAGVSKVGSVTHSGTTNVDCGFSAGSRFVMLKRTDATGDWYVWDSLRGIIAGNDPYLLMNGTAAQVTNTDFIDPLNAGFTITSSFTAGDYIFYAIA